MLDASLLLEPPLPAYCTCALHELLRDFVESHTAGGRIFDRELLLGAERDALLKCLVENGLLPEACVGKRLCTYEFTARGRLAIIAACDIASPRDIFFDTGQTTNHLKC